MPKWCRGGGKCWETGSFREYLGNESVGHYPETSDVHKPGWERCWAVRCQTQTTTQSPGHISPLPSSPWCFKLLLGAQDQRQCHRADQIKRKSRGEKYTPFSKRLGSWCYCKSCCCGFINFGEMVDPQGSGQGPCCSSTLLNKCGLCHLTNTMMHFHLSTAHRPGKISFTMGVTGKGNWNKLK